MTLVFAWHDHENTLYLASDSRISGGGKWDATSKLFPLREDAAIAWAGNTGAALGCVASILGLMAGTKFLWRDTTGLLAVAKRAAGLFNSYYGKVWDTVEQAAPEDNECEILVAGLDRLRVPILYHIKRVQGHQSRVTVIGEAQRFNFVNPFVMGGAEEVTIAQALIKERSANSTVFTPWQILIDVINNDEAISVGGTPCLMRFSPVNGTSTPPYCKRELIAVQSPDGTISILGVPIEDAYRDVEYAIDYAGNIRER